MKKTIMIIIVTAMITGVISIGGAYAATNYAISATKIGYSDNSDLGVDNVQAAIDGTCTKFSSQLTNLKNEVKTETLNEMYPVGSIYISTTLSTKSQVASALGGTWEAFGEGRTLIGVGSNGTSSYNTADSTGGKENNSYTVTSGGSISNYTGTSGSTTLTINQIPSHTHGLAMWAFSGLSDATAGYKYGLSVGQNTGSSASFNGDRSSERFGYATPVGGGEGHTHSINHTHTFTGKSSKIDVSTVQPYITVYMYKRTA